MQVSAKAALGRRSKAVLAGTGACCGPAWTRARHDWPYRLIRAHSDVARGALHRYQMHSSRASCSPPKPNSDCWVTLLF